MSTTTATAAAPPAAPNSDNAAAAAAAAAGARNAITAISTHNQYDNEEFQASHLATDPITQFDAWFRHAQDAKVPEPEAMSVSTCSLQPSSSGGTAALVARPSSRLVLLKQLTPQGFVFYTNYDSRKSRELDANGGYCSLTFYWKEQSRSVRVNGRASKLTKEESQAYFDSRPLGSRVGAHASPQSTVIESRSQLEGRVRDFERRFGVEGAAGLDGAEVAAKHDADKLTKVPVPDYWGGWCVVPDEVEFWVGRKNRLHDRYRYVRPTSHIDDASKPAQTDDAWKIERLAP